MKKVLLAISIIALSVGVYAQIQVKDINPGAGSSNPYLFYPFDSKVLFCANDGTNGDQVYVSDGTNAGTVRLTNLPTLGFVSFGSTGTLGSGGNFKKINNKYYFFAKGLTSSSASSFMYNLWETDGTMLGTSQIDTFPPIGLMSPFFVLKNSSGQDNLCSFLQALPASGAITYNSLYRFNLVTGMSSIIPLNINSHSYIPEIYSKDIRNPSINSNLDSHFTPFVRDNKIYPLSNSGDTLFSMDVDGNLTNLITFPFQVTILSTTAVDMVNTVFIGNKLIIYPNSTTQSFGKEPHIYDFSTNSITLLKDINPYFSNSSECKFFLPSKQNTNGKIYFLATHADYGQELWVTDGTTSGTHILNDISPGTTSSSYHTETHYIGNNFYFSATSFPSGSMKTFRTQGDSVATWNIICDSCVLDNLLYFTTTSHMWRDSASNDDLCLLVEGTSPTFGNTPSRIFKLNSNIANKVLSMNTFSCLTLYYPHSYPVISMGQSLYFGYKDCNSGTELYKLEIDPFLAVDNELKNNDITVYPNPTIGNISIIGGDAYRICLFNLLGEQVRVFNEKNNFSISDLPTGLYILKLYNKNGEIIKTEKVIKK